MNADAASDIPAHSFYLGSGSGYVATPLTAGPWAVGFQHAGPPAALLGRAIERCDGAEEFRVGRITFELRRPVPIGGLTVRTSRQPGRRVDRVEAVLHDAGGTELIRALALRVRSVDTTAAAELAPPAAPALPPPTAPPAPPAAFFPSPVGYHTAMEVSFVTGSWDEPGPAQAWLRPRVALVDDEPCSPLGRVLVAADSGNGLSAVLDPSVWRFVNPDLSVALQREPTSDWVGLAARTGVGGDGRGLAVADVYDLAGPIGSSVQTLLIEPTGNQP